MNWTKLAPVEATLCGCLNCARRYETAPLDMMIAVGFGMAVVKKNKEVIYDEMSSCPDNWDNAWYVKDAEEVAKKDPDNDWRIVMHGPLHGETYQRQGEDEWVLVETNIGFA